MFLTKLSETDSMRLKWGPNVLQWNSGHCQLAFVRGHENWQVHHWLTVLFINESRFTLSTCDRHERVWGQLGEGYVACNITQHDRFGGGSVIAWGGISMAWLLHLCQRTGMVWKRSKWIRLCQTRTAFFEQRRWPKTLLINHLQCSTEFSPRQLNKYSHLGSPSPSNPHEGWLGQGPTSGL